LVNKFNFALSDVILANSYAGLKAYGVDKLSKSKVIHNGFAMKRISNLESKDSIKEKFDIKTKHVVGMVASFSDKKDYTTYIKAALHVLKNRDDVTFLCVGRGDDLKHKEMVPKNYKPLIKFLGKQENVESIMNICDIGVLMSNPDTHGEGISNAIMEFMALGKPVIASINGGNAEIIKQGEMGFIIKPKNYNELSNKINQLIDDYDFLMEMGNAGKERVIKEFSINKMTTDFIKLYKDKISKDTNI
jgi:glycosyltransferase involved in cell wall biosynthesis